MHPLYEMTHKQLGGGVFLSHWGGFSLTELTDLTDFFAHSLELTERLRHTEFTERYCKRWV